MKIKNSKILFLITAILIIQSGIFSVSAASLDLEDAITNGLSQNMDLRIANLNRERTLLELDKQKAANLSTRSRYAELDAEYNLLNAENTHTNASNQIIISIMQQFTGAYLAEMDLARTQKRADLEEINLAEITSQFELGYASELDKLDQDNSYNNAIFNLELAQDSYQRRMHQLGKTLGINLDNLTLNKLPKPQVYEITEQEFLDKAIANSTDLELADMKYELAVIDLERSGITASELDLQIKQLGLEIAELDLIQTREDIIDSFIDDYNSFKESVKRFELQNEILTKTEANHQIVLEQRELGLVTDKDVLQSELTLLDVQYQYEQSIVTYYTNEITLKQAIDELDWGNEDGSNQK